MNRHLLFLFILIFSLKLSAQVPEYKFHRTFGTPIFSPADITLDKENNTYVLENKSVNIFDSTGNVINSFLLDADHRYLTAVDIAVDNLKNIYILYSSGNSKVLKYDLNGKLLLQFGSQGTTSEKLLNPKAITTDEGGNVYVADTDNERIQKFSSSGEFLKELGPQYDPTRFRDGPVDLKVGKSGAIYYLTRSYKIYKIDENSHLIDTINISKPLPSVYSKNGYNNTLAIDKSENIYLSDYSEKKIHKITNSGRYLQSFTVEQMDAHSWPVRIGTAVSQNGDVYASNNALFSIIQVFTPSGNIKRVIGQYISNLDVAQDNQGNYYVLTFYPKKTNQKYSIRKFNSYGNQIMEFGLFGKEQEIINSPVALSTDYYGNVYCLENNYDKAEIKKFSKEGKFITKFEDFGSDFTQSRSKKLTDLAFDSQNNLYVTDFSNSCIRKISPNGHFLKKIGLFGQERGFINYPKALALDVGGNIYVADAQGYRIQKFNPEGQVTPEFIVYNQGSFDGFSIVSIAVDLAGYVYGSDGAGRYIHVYDPKGKEYIQSEQHIGKFKHSFGEISINKFGNKILIAGGSVVREFFIGDIPKESLITGKIYQDINRNCKLDANEKPLPGIVVTAEPGPYYGVSDEQGNYAIPVDTGQYVIKTILPQEVGKTITPTCPATANKTVSVPDYGTVVTGPNFGNQVSTAPVLNVEVASNRRRRCFRNTTTVSYANTGFAAAQNAKVMVQLPEFVSFISANAAYTQDNKGHYIFAVGALQPNQRGTITIIDSVSCANPSIRGLTVCTKAWITPANTYTTAANWNQAAISVTGKMTTEGQARFVIQNKGQGNMTDSLAFRVFQNVDLVLRSKYQLAAGDSLVLRFTPTSRVVRVEVDQPDGHPLKASASANLEVKSKNAARAPAPLMVAYPPDDPEPEISEDCQPIIDSFDPNDKQVIPAGLTANHYTPTNTPLRYTVRFQNTGTDVAYRVVVVDTLATDLEISTLQVGAVSHAYTLTISGKVRPVLTFTFDNIMLPDSSKNLAGSNGFISFTIKPKSNLPEKTEIKNFADIFFDYNEPVRTNTTFNQIYDVPLVLNDSQQLKAANIITTPTIRSFSPAQSRAGEVVTIMGKNFAVNAADNTVTFNGVKATVRSASAEELTVRVPEEAFSGKIKIATVDGAAQSQTDYIIFQAPTLTAVSVNEGVPGQVITLTGNYFSPEAALDTVLFNGIAAKIREASETQLQVEVPTAAPLSKILIKTRGGQVESTWLFQVWYPPVITSFNPGKGKVGQIITITGSNFAEEASRNKVQFGGVMGQVVQATNHILKIQVPPGAISGLIQVKTPGGITATSTLFTFIPAPVIFSFTPTSGNAGALITLNGQNFNADSQTDTVFFNRLPAKILKITPTDLVVQAPKAIQSGAITVAGAGGRTTTSEFKVLDLTPDEAISLYPNPAQNTVTINWYKADFKAESLRMYNALGQLVLTKSLINTPQDELQLSLTTLPTGVYTIRIQSARGPITKRLVKW